MNLAKYHPLNRKALPFCERPLALKSASSLQIRLRSSLQADKNNAMTSRSKGFHLPTFWCGPPAFPPANDNQGVWPQHPQESVDLISTQIQMSAELEGAQLQAANQVGKKAFGKRNRH